MWNGSDSRGSGKGAKVVTPPITQRRAAQWTVRREQVFDRRSAAKTLPHFRGRAWELSILMRHTAERIATDRQSRSPCYTAPESMPCRSSHLDQFTHRNSQPRPPSPESLGFSIRSPTPVGYGISRIARSSPTLPGSSILSCSITSGTRGTWGRRSSACKTVPVSQTYKYF